MTEKIEGVIKGLFTGGGYIQPKDGQLFIYYDSNLRNPDPEVLKKNNRVIALKAGLSIIEIRLKEDNMHWAEAMYHHLLL